MMWFMISNWYIFKAKQLKDDPNFLLQKMMAKQRHPSNIKNMDKDKDGLV